MRNKLLFLIVIQNLITLNLYAGRLHGTIFDAADRSTLPTASVYVEGRIDAGTEADDNGKYSLNLADGKYTICCEFLGYQKQTVEVKVKGNTTLNFAMETSTEQLGEVVVKANSSREVLEAPQMSVARLEVKDLKRMPAIFGEQDVIKSLQLMPGVKAESDASGGFQVRGGEASQNLVTLDGATINNAGHLLGFFPAFNPDILRDVTLYKGAMPAQYGGRTSSVLDINTISGDYEKFGGDAAIGLLASKFDLKGPIVKDKLTYYVSARRSYADLFLKATEDLKNTTLYFYDINAKISYKIGNRDYMFLSFFNSKDNFGMKDLGKILWGNTVGTGKWWHQFNNQTDLSSTLFYSRYHSVMGMDISEISIDYNGKNAQLSLNEDLRWKPDSCHTLHMGWQSSYYDVVSSDWTNNGIREKEERYGLENALWVNDEWKITKRLSASYGLRFDIFSVLGGSPYYDIDLTTGDIINTHNYASGDVVENYCNWEPRLSANYKLNQHQSVKASYSRSSQNVHTIKESITSMPVDRNTLTSNYLKPETADQFSVGYAATIANEKKNQDDAYSIETEIYYKKMGNVTDYREGLQNETYTESDRLLVQGEGRSYGWEINIKKNHGKLTGWISYTLSKTESQIDQLNEGRWYLANSDRRHSINIVAMYSLSKHWDVSAAWTFNSGQAFSLPTAKYEVNGQTVYYYANKNNYRTPNYHRLDLSATRHGKQHPHWQGEWAFGLFNAYGRYNPFMINLKEDKESLTGTKAQQISLFSFVPSVTYRIKF